MEMIKKIEASQKSTNDVKETEAADATNKAYRAATINYDQITLGNKE
jgi:hypothetical protein